MSDYTTNGYLMSLLDAANANTTHQDHSDARHYVAKFRDLEVTLFEKVHPFVDMGLAISEVRLAGDGDPHIFTVHGCRHISDLIRSLDKLAEAIAERPADTLTVLEAYLLLCAAHVHDAANVGKRDNHPERGNEVLEQYKDLFANPMSIQQIWDIASVHGGSHPEYGKDTFRSIRTDNSTPPRIPLLAALLRLGDELSENSERVPESVTQHHDPSNESKLHHAYARSFGPFEFRKESLYLVFNIYRSQHELRVVIDRKEVGFYRFLEDRLDKIDRESRYCSQYARPVMNIGKISVIINLYEGNLPSQVLAEEKFTLHLSHGYPDDQNSLCERSPELKSKGVKTLEILLREPHD